MPSGHLEKRYKSSWTIVINAGMDASGRRIRIKRSIKGSKKEAEAVMAQILSELQEGTYIQPSKMLFSDYLDKWLDFVKDRLAHKTYKRYKGIIENYLKPELGYIKLADLKPLHIQEHYKGHVQRRRMPRLIRQHGPQASQPAAHCPWTGSQMAPASGEPGRLRGTTANRKI